MPRRSLARGLRLDEGEFSAGSDAGKVSFCRIALPIRNTMWANSPTFAAYLVLVQFPQLCFRVFIAFFIGFRHSASASCKHTGTETKE